AALAAPPMKIARARKESASKPQRAPEPGEADWLERIAPGGTRLLFFGGKGGVGKTTAAAAAAGSIARRGTRGPLPPIHPAHWLGDALRMPTGDQEREVATSLRARELDAARAFSRRRDRHRAAVEELFATLRGGSAFDAPYDRAVLEDLIELSPPGLDELF